MSSMFGEVKSVPGTVYGAAPARKTGVWKGDHRGCEIGHADGVCRSLQAWRLNGEHKLVPVIVGRSIERRHASDAEYAEESGEEQRPAWQAKGFRVPAEAIRARPTVEIVQKIRELGAEGVVRTLQHQKASFADQQTAKTQFLAAFDAANAPAKEKKAKTDG